MRIFTALLLCTVAVFAADQPRRAPGFALPDPKMEVHDLYDYRGKPVILEFMQTTCGHCAGFVTVLQKIQQKYGDKVQILAVVVPPDNMTTVSQFIEGHKISYPVLFDMGQVVYSYVRQGHVNFPQAYLIDAKGMIHAHFDYNNALDRDIFDGNGLINEVDRLLTTKK
jgi:peroxiredoxin